jgi:hypothetical protein
LFLAKFVKDIEFLSQSVNSEVTHTSKFNLHDNLSVGHHHSDSSEKHLKIFGELLSSGITGIHGNEISDGVEDFNEDDFFREPEFFEVLFFGLGD